MSNKTFLVDSLTDAESVDFAQISLNHPNKWALIGNPKWASGSTQLLKGILLAVSDNKAEIYAVAKEASQYMQEYTIRFTGILPRPASYSTGIYRRIA
jgi:hypothetical protein